jgi:hypothetical protein
MSHTSELEEVGFVGFKTVSALRQSRASVPEGAGVDVVLDGDRAIYVGQSGDVSDRLRQLITRGRPSHRGGKAVFENVSNFDSLVVCWKELDEDRWLVKRQLKERYGI